MIRSTLATLTVSMAVATAFAQSTDKSCQSSTVKKPSAAISSSRLKPAVLHAKPSAGTTIPRKPRAVLPPVTNALFGPKPAPPALVVPSTLPATAALIVPPIAPLIVPHPRDVSVHPNLEFVPTSNEVVRDMHLRPLYTSTILIFVKPSTHLPAESNLLIAFASGETISIRLISPGDAGSTDPTDFVVDYRGRKSMFESRAVVLGTPGRDLVGPSPDNVRRVEVNEEEPLSSHSDITVSGHSTLPLSTDSALDHQLIVGSPHWVTVPELAKLIKANALAPNCIAIAIGDIRQEGDDMVVSFSILNISHHWVSIMPPQIELTNPLRSTSWTTRN